MSHDPPEAFERACPCRESCERDQQTMRDLYDDIEQARGQLAEAQALLALWSGGKAGTVPEGWSIAPAYRDTRGRRLILRIDDAIAWVFPDGAWEVRFSDYMHHEGRRVPGPRPILTACAEARAWAEKEGK